MASTSACVSGSRNQASMSNTVPPPGGSAAEPVPWMDESSRIGLPASGAR